MGQPYERARAVYARQKILIQAAGERYSDVPRGIILDQNPRAGSVMEQAAILVLVAKGLPPTPDLRGMTLDQAQRRYVNQLLIRAASQVPHESARGTIVQQQPVPGAALPPNRNIEVVVSAGIARIPDLVGSL